MGLDAMGSVSFALLDGDEGEASSMWGLGTFSFESTSILILLYGDRGAGLGGWLPNARGWACQLLCEPGVQLGGCCRADLG